MTNAPQEFAAPKPASRLLAKLGLHRPELRAWAMYDWANSAMVTIIITAVFPFFYSASSGLPEEVATWRYGAFTMVAILMVAVMSPILGAVADFAGIRKHLLAAFMMFGLAGVAAMFFIREGQWLWAGILFIVANIGATGSFVFYDALLPYIASDDEIDRVSTAGFALGYIGGGLVLALALLMVVRPGWFGLPVGSDLPFAQASLPVRLSFLLVAVWWTIFALPLFFKVPEPPRRIEADETGSANPIRVAFIRLGETFRELRKYKHAFILLIAFLIYSDGIGTIIRMAVIYGKELGIPRQAMMGAILITQFVGIPFAFLFGSLAGWLGAKRSIFLGLGVYMLICVVGYFMRTATHFYVLAALVGMVQGGTQALSRSLFATMIPRHKSGEFFGFFGIMDKFSGSIGTGIMTLLSVVTRRTSYGILAIVVLFIVGAWLLTLVNVEEGKRAAREAEQNTL